MSWRDLLSFRRSKYSQDRNNNVAYDAKLASKNKSLAPTKLSAAELILRRRAKDLGSEKIDSKTTANGRRTSTSACEPSKSSSTSRKENAEFLEKRNDMSENETHARKVHRLDLKDSNCKKFSEQNKNSSLHRNLLLTSKFKDRTLIRTEPAANSNEHPVSELIRTQSDEASKEVDLKNFKLQKPEVRPFQIAKGFYGSQQPPAARRPIKTLDDDSDSDLESFIENDEENEEYVDTDYMPNMAFVEPSPLNDNEGKIHGTCSTNTWRTELKSMLGRLDPRNFSEIDKLPERIHTTSFEGIVAEEIRSTKLGKASDRAEALKRLVLRQEKRKLLAEEISGDKYETILGNDFSSDESDSSDDSSDDVDVLTRKRRKLVSRFVKG